MQFAEKKIVWIGTNSTNRTFHKKQYYQYYQLLDICKICYMIQGLSSYNLLTDKVTGKVPWTIYWPDKKSWKVPECWKLTFHKGQYLKPSNINFASVFDHVRKKLEFTDPTHTIYWPKNIAKEAANCWTVFVYLDTSKM